MKHLTSTFWGDYELIDTGGLEKLERFGKYVLTRPEPQAVWEKSLQLSEWDNRSHAVYKRTKGMDPAKAEGYEKGEWIRKPEMPDQWIIGYEYKEMHLKFRLGLTQFGHVGVFPEQAENWNYIYDLLWPGREGYRILNLFAYTGGASLAAKSAEAADLAVGVSMAGQNLADVPIIQASIDPCYSCTDR